MQKILSIAEFDDFCRVLNPKCFVYATDNQEKNIVFSPLNLTMRYNILRTSPFTDCIYFIGDGGSLRFERVKCVQLDDIKSVVGIVFDIICESPGGIVSYTLIAD